MPKHFPRRLFLNPKVVSATSFRRKLRGGSQCHLIACEDGHSYAVKFKNNPQHRRVLVNELVSAVLLDYLQIATPESAIVNLSREFLCDNPDVFIRTAGKDIPIEAGFHFGSRYPGDPDQVAVYDFLPDRFLRKVVNLRDFLGILVFDKWVGNGDGRQAVFCRARVFDGPSSPPTSALVARMIDNGFALGGPEWRVQRSPVQGLYIHRAVYEGVRGLDAFEPWLTWVRDFPPEIIDRAWKSIPPDWLAEDDEARLMEVLERLYRRRRELPELLQECRTARPTPFPYWY